MSERVVVAMSGGVDSSVAALLLKEAGYGVIGMAMRLCEEESRHLKAAAKAQRVCQILDTPFYYVNLEREFKRYVVDYFCHEYSLGQTPNPCIICNQDIKFGILLHRALAMGADYLATGHYARIERRGERYYLLTGIDATRDQSYFLYTLGQWELRHLLFPLGEYSKDEICRIAAGKGLPISEESRDLCFIPDGDYRRFLARHSPTLPGDITDVKGSILGRHRGLALYTIGQRQGLGLPSKERLYVLSMDPVRNCLIVGAEEMLFRDALLAQGVNFISGEMPEGAVGAKVRYRSPQVEAFLSPQGSRIRVQFSEPQRAITPGQAVVFYQGEVVLGGGVIERSWDMSL
jgi:tRNA-specific 2-thiouridylase